jgi:hydrogenase maturation protease
MKGKVLVAGIGNIFFGDDGFGIEVVRRLHKTQLPDHVTVIDYGIRSYDLAYALMEDWDLVLLVDALPGGGKPGTLYLFEPEMSGEGALTTDAHTMNPGSVLELVRAMGGQPGRVLVVGCEPATVEPDQNGNLSLSPAIAAAVDGALPMIQELVVGRPKQARAA